jgi:hypothetical protein
VIPRSSRNLGQQLAAVRNVLPATSGKIRNGELSCLLTIRPSPASRRYAIRLRYKQGAQPHITVVEPDLELHPDAAGLPHVYPGDELCLYYPGQWNPGQLIATTIVPWISEWLLHYEIWTVTGTWHGGGAEHPARGGGRMTGR